MKIPLFDLTRQNDVLMPDLLAASERVIRSGQFILGEELEKLEEEAAELFESTRSLAVSSGTDALLLTMMTAGIGPSDEVIVPDFTFFCTAGCVARLGARPVFADICPETFNMLPESFESRITDRTKAVVPVHLFGQAAPMVQINEIAKKNDLVVIEDCAQSIGAKFQGKPTGMLGDLAAVSFFPTKNLGGFGDGGLLLAKSDNDFDRAKILRVHGMKPKYFHGEIGANFRMDALQAALLRIKVPHLDSYNRSRRKNASLYQDCLKDHSLVHLPPADSDAGASEVDSSKLLVLPKARAPEECIWNQFTVRVTHGLRDDFRSFLSNHGIGSEIYYPLPLSQQTCFAYANPGHCPNAIQVSKECVSLPIFPELRTDEVERVAEIVRSWLDLQHLN